MNKKEIITLAVVGPTGVGKSELAFELAHKLSGAVISVDAMQVYQGMDIGTAKVTKTPYGIKQYGVNLVSPDEPYSVALYQRYARSKIHELIKDKTMPILCGGTGLYVDATLRDFEFSAGEQVNNELRKKYELLGEKIGRIALHEHLEELDPESANKIHPHNTRRVIRALELHEMGESYAQVSSSRHDRAKVVPSFIIGLTMDRQMLYDRINERVLKMIQKGLLDEIEVLINSGYKSSITAEQAIGYKEFVPVLEGKKSLDEAIAEVQQATRRYAKRQITWFKKSVDKWIDVTDLTLTQRIDKALSFKEINAYI